MFNFSKVTGRETLCKAAVSRCTHLLIGTNYVRHYKRHFSRVKCECGRKTKDQKGSHTPNTYTHHNHDTASCLRARTRRETSGSSGRKDSERRRERERKRESERKRKREREREPGESQ